MEETRESKSKGIPSNPVRLNCWTLLWKLALLVMLPSSWVLLDRKPDLLMHLKKKLQLVRLKKVYLVLVWCFCCCCWLIFLVAFCLVGWLGDFLFGWFLLFTFSLVIWRQCPEQTLNQILKYKLNENENNVFYLPACAASLLLLQKFQHRSAVNPAQSKNFQILGILKCLIASPEDQCKSWHFIQSNNPGSP